MEFIIFSIFFIFEILFTITGYRAKNSFERKTTRNIEGIIINNRRIKVVKNEAKKELLKIFSKNWFNG